jgi:hypothetical protein
MHEGFHNLEIGTSEGIFPSDNGTDENGEPDPNIYSLLSGCAIFISCVIASYCDRVKGHAKDEKLPVTEETPAQKVEGRRNSRFQSFERLNRCESWHGYRTWHLWASSWGIKIAVYALAFALVDIS